MCVCILLLSNLVYLILYLKKKCQSHIQSKENKLYVRSYYRLHGTFSSLRIIRDGHASKGVSKILEHSFIFYNKLL